MLARASVPVLLPLVLALCGRCRAAGPSAATSPQPHRPTVRILNGTRLELGCLPAERLVRTHMAPDFEHPQLVRRLDWFHDDSLVASFQQDAAEPTRQFWVAGPRVELRPPFYALLVRPALPEDSGLYRCRLETDPLFAEDETGPGTPVLVMVRPPAPSKPQLTASTENSLTISWAQTAAAAHRPVLRYSVLVNRLEDESLRVLTSQDNGTQLRVDSLLPYTRYGLSVRAENPAGSSEFGPEAVYRTLGEAPREPPALQLLRNGSAGCADLAWRAATADQNGRPLLGFRIMLHRVGSGAMREWYVKNHRQSLCSLEPDADYKLSIEADNGFGYSPARTVTFHTDDGVPEGPPQAVEVRPLAGDTVLIVWKEPARPNGRVLSYQIYFQRAADSARLPASMVRLMVSKDLSRAFAYNLTKLVPEAPVLTRILYKCGADVTLEWRNESWPVSFYKLFLETKSRTVVLNSTQPRLLLPGLESARRYSVRLSAVLRSRYSNLSYFESAFSQPHSFSLDFSECGAGPARPADACQLQASLCAPGLDNCRRVGAVGRARGASLLFTALLVASFALCAALTALCLARRCRLLKRLLAKADEKGGHETVSLVYDTETSDTLNSSAVVVARFEQHCADMARNDNEGFRRQFEELEADSEVQSEESAEPSEAEQSSKNRYRNIGAVERTRIRIQHPSAGEDGYINANYVDSCDERNTYIATQAPLPHTFADFYGMLWQEKCNVVVAITNLVEDGKRKCDQYWPESSKAAPLSFGHLQVSLTAEMTNANFVHRILTLRSSKCMSPDRVLHQVHLTSWPDHGVPSTVFPLLSFVNYVADIQSLGPVVVHCSAGVGRSGSFILIDSMRRHLLHCDHLNMFAHLRHIRRQRQHLVQTLEQYVFCHRVVRELIRHGITRQSVPNFPNYLRFLYHQVLPDGRTRLQMQYEEVCMCRHSPACRPPPGFCCLPGYHRPDEFLVANWPRECPELWRLLWERGCQTLVLFGADAEVGDFFRSLPARSRSEPAAGPGSELLPRRKGVSLPAAAEQLQVRREDEEHVLVRSREEELCVRIVRLRPAELELHTWAEMERMQDQLLEAHRCQMLFVDPSNSAMPFVVCALQSAACQLEQERFVDVLQFLAAYRERRCGCWAAQSNVEYIYEKVLELTALHRS